MALRCAVFLSPGLSLHLRFKLLRFLADELLVTQWKPGGDSLHLGAPEVRHEILNPKLIVGLVSSSTDAARKASA